MAWTIRRFSRSFVVILFAFGVTSGCSVLATRPVQEMSDTAAAIKAAREVQADTLTPELYRKATEWFNQAKREYRLKNFKKASDYAALARVYAEQAEFEIAQRAVSHEVLPELPTPPAQPAAEPSPAPTAVPTAPTTVPKGHSYNLVPKTYSSS